MMMLTGGVVLLVSTRIDCARVCLVLSLLSGQATTDKTTAAVRVVESHCRFSGNPIPDADEFAARTQPQWQCRRAQTHVRMKTGIVSCRVVWHKKGRDPLVSGNSLAFGTDGMIVSVARVFGGIVL